VEVRSQPEKKKCQSYTQQFRSGGISGSGCEGFNKIEKEMQITKRPPEQGELCRGGKMALRTGVKVSSNFLLQWGVRGEGELGSYLHGARGRS